MKTAGLILAAAGLLGAAGVALGAVAAHRVQDPALATAANYLVVSAAAGAALANVSLVTTQRLFAVAAVLLLAGAALFSGDIATRSFTGGRLFAFAAPLGGSTMILGWLVAAVAGLMAVRRRD